MAEASAEKGIEMARKSKPSLLKEVRSEEPQMPLFTLNKVGRKYEMVYSPRGHATGGEGYSVRAAWIALRKETQASFSEKLDFHLGELDRMKSILVEKNLWDLGKRKRKPKQDKNVFAQPTEPPLEPAGEIIYNCCSQDSVLFEVRKISDDQYQLEYFPTNPDKPGFLAAGVTILQAIDKMIDTLSRQQLGMWRNVHQDRFNFLLESLVKEKLVEV